MGKEHDPWLGNVLGVTWFGSQSDKTPAAPATCNEVRPSEMVAGASGVQYSKGETTAHADEEGGDFAEGSRKNADANTHDNQQFAGYNQGSNPMQSPDLAKPGDFALRYGIGFLCSKYPKGWNSLEDIAEYSKPNSKFLQAFAGMNKSQLYKNPDKNKVLAEIASWTGLLSKALAGCGQGELVITFQGHGQHGSFFASDGGEITTSEMMALAKKAESSRVSITYVMDACFSGGAVPDFQDHAADAVDKRIEKNVEGKGEVCSEENHQNAEKLRDQMAHARELIEFSRTLARHGDILHGLISDIKADVSSVAAWDAAMKENQAIIEMIQTEQGQFQKKIDFGNDPRMHLEPVTGAFTTVLSYLNAIKPQTCFDYSQWTGAIGKFQDQISDDGNRIINLLQEESS